MKDKDIIHLYNLRSEVAIQETDKKYGKYCHQIAYNILVNTQDAEECVNDTYLRTWDAIPPSMPQHLPAFLGKITRNLSLNKKKGKGRQKRSSGQYEIAYEELENTFAAHSLVETEYEFAYIAEKINCFLTQLTMEKRKTFIGRYWYFFSIDEIAEHMGYSASKTKMILLRVRNDLKDFLEKEGVYL